MVLTDITIIIPVLTLDEQEQNFLVQALTSIKTQKGDYPNSVLIPYKASEETKSTLESIVKEFAATLTIELLENTDEVTSIQAHLNLGAEATKTKYFSYLELDDQYTPIYFQNVEKYIKGYPDTSVFLPMGVDMANAPDGTRVAIKYTNDFAFSRDVTEDTGVVSFDALQKTPQWSISGGIFKTEDYLYVGKLKNNIKYTFVYEYLLRATDQAQHILVIPKLGYLHEFNRPNSYTFTELNNNQLLTQEELGFWYDTAKKQYYFRNTDKKITYKPNLQTV